ncbi:hypothetical protein [Sodalis sp. RH23]|uniref:hypothetical protein n=1 Tax=unclassified Sodalis (in: enterobacteria) TaxID=2636512 RepID=UPI0039B43BC5
MIMKNGTIVSGEYNGWEIQVVDDTLGDTGGYYLIFQNSDKVVFDYWFEKREYLDNQLTDYSIKWND